MHWPRHINASWWSSHLNYGLSCCIIHPSPNPFSSLHNSIFSIRPMKMNDWQCEQLVWFHFERNWTFELFSPDGYFISRFHSFTRIVRKVTSKRNYINMQMLKCLKLPFSINYMLPSHCTTMTEDTAFASYRRCSLDSLRRDRRRNGETFISRSHQFFIFKFTL